MCSTAHMQPAGQRHPQHLTRTELTPHHTSRKVTQLYSSRKTHSDMQEHSSLRNKELQYTCSRRKMQRQEAFGHSHSHNAHAAHTSSFQEKHMHMLKVAEHYSDSTQTIHHMQNTEAHMDRSFGHAEKHHQDSRPFGQQHHKDSLHMQNTMHTCRKTCNTHARADKSSRPYRNHTCIQTADHSDSTQKKLTHAMNTPITRL
ncbi:hypothetical protein I3842_09G133700 [Carya illinoinensis]|uniref:Uncharacterized protein n=1 Tax=Carya illinoinensis TaxID=32201 RepID=A0A922J663_CARIL|nr:hypothetical protein I3842_09G133700 [Carya illinoinensis]